MSGFMSTYPLTPQLYEEMLQLRETKVGVIRHILCKHYGIEMKYNLAAEIEKILDEKLANEVGCRQVSKIQLTQDIINTYFVSRPTFVARPVEEIDAEIEAKIWERKNPLYNPNRKPGMTRKVKNSILTKRLHLRDINRLDGAIAHMTELTGKTREEVERDLLCAHFGIKQVVE